MQINLLTYLLHRFVLTLHSLVFGYRYFPNARRLLVLAVSLYTRPALCLRVFVYIRSAPGVNVGITFVLSCR